MAGAVPERAVLDSGLANNGVRTMSTLRANGLRFSRLRRAFLAVLAMATIAAIAVHSGSVFAQQKQQQKQQRARP